MRLILPGGTFKCRTVLDVSKEVFSVRRDELDPGVTARGAARGKLEEVPGTPAFCAPEPATSSDFCDVTMTDFVGSRTSSLCSVVVKSQSAVTPTRKCPSPRSGSRVDSIFATRSFSIWCL